MDEKKDEKKREPVSHGPADQNSPQGQMIKAVNNLRDIMYKPKPRRKMW